MSALEHDMERLDELVDGQQPWSHRKRLHALENDQDARRFAAQALEAFHQARNNRWTRVREWGAFVLAIAAVVVASHPWG